MTIPAKKRAGTAKKSDVSDASFSPSAIQKSMTVSAILQMLPEAEPVLAEYGLHCFHCSANTLENLEEGCRSHGFEDAEIDALVEDLNGLLKEKPPRPQTLTVTTLAAEALAQVMESEGKKDHSLQVIADENGSFCMEFTTQRAEDEKEFTNPEVPAVRIFASAITLNRIGGASIDFRDGRFKLDLPEDSANACGCDGKSCACGQK